MSIPCVLLQIPLKVTQSERLPGKNFKILYGKPLFFWIIQTALRTQTIAKQDNLCDIDIYIDSEDPAVFDAVKTHFVDQPLNYFLRHPYYASNAANGNHLLRHISSSLSKSYDFYSQAYVTSPFLSPNTLIHSLQQLLRSTQYDSAFTCTYDPAWIWYQGTPVNYNHLIPDGLPRSQDALITKESAGFYVINSAAHKELHTRLGHTPLPINISPHESQDIDTNFDWLIAERISDHLPK